MGKKKKDPQDLGCHTYLSLTPPWMQSLVIVVRCGIIPLHLLSE